ncbi:uncharacterized protein LOC126737379 isoform X2 [Anthonomus grandis grandis]|uniref:uncharacterized protein LOC126737379 isoform X2 n=1 Tax=Anthonomus grandis grandis TaxID=2921223 RepID=UPI002166B8D7|nr:uncharacterized protein LOC126737379 isoform X2 [Anthonomus grandis grandis]
MKVSVLLVCLIWFKVNFSVPVEDLDIFAEEVVQNEVEKGNFSNMPDNIRRIPRGICMNTYECRIEGGKSYGFCALGFGVCCVFRATCKQEVINNLTYFVNPDFPDLTRGMSSCSLKVKKIESEVSQIRFDFIHFNLGQPNRKTGICEEDVFKITGENTTKDLIICGMNSGQHVYVDVENIDELNVEMTLSKKAVSRIWEIIITQVSFSEGSPPGCLQYFTGRYGTVQTMNFADNGRHLANQDYNICIRQEENMCSITYEPCHENAFRISPNSEDTTINTNLLAEGSGDGESDDLRESFRAIEMCNDRIILPCDTEELIMPGMFNLAPGSCNLIHCGLSLCPSGNDPCKIESSATPFNIGVHFGNSAKPVSPEDNLGMCLNYEQIPCE